MIQTAIMSKHHLEKHQTDRVEWGRCCNPSSSDKFGALFILISAPTLVLSLYLTSVSYNGSLWLMFQDFLNHDFQLIYNNLPSFNGTVLIGVCGWVIFQLALAKLPDMIHKYIPFYIGGIQVGQLTPAGHKLNYNINGLQAWIITHILFAVFGLYLRWFDPAIIANNWGSILVAANIFGCSLTIFSYIKAHLFSSHYDDNKFSGCWYYDLVWGIEFNPRMFGIDFKMFFNGRPGILAWTLINLSFASSQYEQHGLVTNSMILVNILQAFYVIDFFWNEKWYLKTIDIAHDHYGFMLAWGSCVVLPFMYTVQTVYLIQNPVILNNQYFWVVLTMGLIGYTIFRWTNSQKDYFRRTADKSKCRIWLKKVKYIECQFKTKSGPNKEHTSYLLCSGFWGLARHFNYTGDLILSLAYCLACGTQHVLPYFYAIYMLLLLITRCYRDEGRCKRKYGLVWDKYCKKVPYRLIPYIF